MLKNLAKDNKGITLIVLIITIITMLILTSVSIYSGIDTYKSTQITKFVTQMKLIQTKVDELVELNEEINLGEQITNEQKIIVRYAYNNNEIMSNEEEYISNYKYFSNENLNSQFDLENVNDDIMINFKTREVVSVNGIKYKGETYYTQYKLPGGQILNSYTPISRDLDFDLNCSMDGLNATITINNITITNATLSYKEETDTYWKAITNYTENEKDYNILISKSGIYRFKLIENAVENELIKSVVINVTNKPKLYENMQFVNSSNGYNYAQDSSNWAYAQDANSLNYVWIPRFAYKIDSSTNTTEIKFLKGNSNIATDNTYIDTSWAIHEKFTSTLTGIWVNVTNANEDGIEIIQLLNSEATTITEI